MAPRTVAKFIQIATSCADVGGRLFTIVHALDAEGNVWQFRPDTRPGVDTGDQGTWIRLSSDRK